MSQLTGERPQHLGPKFTSEANSNSQPEARDLRQGDAPLRPPSSDTQAEGVEGAGAEGQAWLLGRTSG